ncbi:PRTRC genetic system protein B [Mesoflavibacter sabulilitoris]|nr:PRTRC genetic system protein B [Mesoflavibacter zeaxanthinifaciens subsp. sabulilitoris]
MKPQFTITGYSSNSNFNTSYFLEFRSVLENGTLSEGKPLYKDTLKNIVQYFEVETQTWTSKGVFPKNIIALNMNEKSVIWSFNRSEMYLHFKDDTSIKSGLYHLPKLIFKLSNHKLSVFAVKHFGKHAKLYYAPFFNVYDSCDVCMGNANLEFNSFDISDIIKTTEITFFKSLFTHSNHENLFNNSLSHKENHKRWLNSNQPFDNNLLFPLKSNQSILSLSQSI